MTKQELVKLVRSNIGMPATLENDHVIDQGTIMSVAVSTNRIKVRDASTAVKGEKPHNLGEDSWLLPKSGAEMKQVGNKIVVTWQTRNDRRKNKAPSIMKHTLTIHVDA